MEPCFLSFLPPPPPPLFFFLFLQRAGPWVFQTKLHNTGRYFFSALPILFQKRTYYEDHSSFLHPPFSSASFPSRFSCSIFLRLEGNAIPSTSYPHSLAPLFLSSVPKSDAVRSVIGALFPKSSFFPKPSKSTPPIKNQHFPSSPPHFLALF